HRGFACRSPGRRGPFRTAPYRPQRFVQRRDRRTDVSETTSTVHRRAFLRGALGVGAGAVLAGPFSALATRAAAASPAGGPGHGRGHGGYGPLHPVRDETTG